MEINKEFIEGFFGGKRMKNYTNAVDTHNHLSFHFDGYYLRPWVKVGKENPWFKRLIDERRPSESDTINKYRRMQYVPITKAPCHSIINSLKKIVKSSDWHIDYSSSENPSWIPDLDTLEVYCEKLYPASDSIENWAYTTLMRWLLIDPNGLICVMPLSWEVEPNEYIRPYAHIIQSKDVYDYKEGELCVFLSPYETSYTDKDGNHCHGRIIMVVTKDCYYECQEIGDNINIIEHVHNIGEMPAFLLGGESKSPDIQQPFYESFIESVLPYFDQAAQDSSDLTAEKVQHLYSTEWGFQGQNCDACQGSRMVLSKGKQIVCPSCEDRASRPKSPYISVELNANNPMFDNKNIPIPPGGFITKPTIEMVKMMRSEINGEIYSGLASLNMQFLAKEPLSESGTAKEVDRDELNNFVYSVAYHLVENLINPIYYFINELRYSTIVPNKDIRLKMLPKVPVPQAFDFLSDKNVEDNLVKISSSSVSPEIKDLAEIDFLHSKYQDNSKVVDTLTATRDHNPLRSYSISDIQSMLTAGLISKQDAVLSVYINSFVSTLMEENENWVDLPFDKQRESLNEMAATKEEELSAATAIKKKAELKDKIALNNSLPEGPAIVPEKIEAKELGMKQRKKDRNSL